MRLIDSRAAGLLFRHKDSTVGSLSVPVLGSFVGGAFAFSPNSSFGSLGLRSATTNAQGFHGIQRNFVGNVSNTLPCRNVMFRVSGNVIIPVELLEFEVE